ncbi:TPA: hypothetical protein ACX6PJ_001217 [Photobacterium damselae]
MVIEPRLREVRLKQEILLGKMTSQLQGATKTTRYRIDNYHPFKCYQR